MITELTLDDLQLEIEWDGYPIEVEGIWIQKIGKDGKPEDVSIIDALNETFIARIVEKLYVELDNRKYGG